MNRPITLKRDIIKDYASKRKVLSEADVRDLFRCAINFLKDDVEHRREYAYEIPHLGFMYRKLIDMPYMETHKHPNLLKDMMRETVFSEAKKPLILRKNLLRQSNYPVTLEELEPIQNAMAEQK